MGASPPVTVLLPTYNRRKFLPRSVKCIVDQTFADWRLLVVNDGGEAVGDVVASFGDPRIEYVSLPHRGKAGALNAALGMVRSEYVAYMDDDDEVFPDHLRLLYDEAVRSASGFVYSDTWLRIVDSRTGAVLKEYVENDLDVTTDMLRIQNYINHKQVMHRKDLADSVGGFDEEFVGWGAEDDVYIMFFDLDAYFSMIYPQATPRLQKPKAATRLLRAELRVM